MRSRWHSDEGSAVVEFLLVGVLLTALTLGVLQLALGLHVRNTLQDAASEGARWASLVGSSPQQGIARTSDLITQAVGTRYAQDVSVRTVTWLGAPAIQITVRTSLPMVGLWGPGPTVEVSGHGAMEKVG
jgi:Flp pilus assembly protein TadG